MTGTESASHPFRVVLVSTAVAGILGYAVQLLAPVLLRDGPDYVAFSVVWSTVYLGVSALSGVQQEIARATSPARETDPPAALRGFTLATMAVVLVVSAALVAVVGPTILPEHPWELGAAIAVGLVGYVLAAVLSGVFYGVREWRGVAFAIVSDAALRAVLVVVGLALNAPTIVLALLVAVPFGLAGAATWLVFRRRVVGRYRVDVGMRALGAHAAATVIAAAASGVLISGLPMIIGVTSTDVAADTTGALILAITVTRAPIVVPVLALQSLLISTVFRDGHRRRPAPLVAAAAAALVLLSAFGAALGPWAVGLLSAGRFSLSPLDAGLIVASAVLVGAMCVTGPALVARRRHLANTAGWLVAAALTVTILVLPLDAHRVVIALVVPPVAGIAVHLWLSARPGPARGPSAVVR